MKNYILILSILLITGLNISAQTEDIPQVDIIWSTYYGNKEDEWYMEIELDKEGNIYFCGIRENKNSDRHYFLGKFDSNCNLLWEYKEIDFIGDSFHYGINISVDSSNNLVVGGLNYLAKYSPKGELLWKKLADKNGNLLNISFRDIECDEEDNIYVGEHHYEFYKYDKNGKLLWSKINDSTVYGYGFDYSLYNENIFQIKFDYRDIEDSIKLIKRDKNTGEELSSKYIKLPLLFDNYFDFTHDNYGNIIIAGNLDSITNNYYSCIWKIDSLGNTIFFTKIQARHHDNGHWGGRNHNDEGVITTDLFGNIYFLGHNIDIKYKHNARKEYITIHKLSPSGQILWRFKFDGRNILNPRYSNMDRPNTIKYHPPNTIYFSGYTQSEKGIAYGNPYKDTLESYNESDGFITKLNVETIAIETYDKKVENIIDTIDFGEICIGDSSYFDAKIKNYSDFDINMEPPFLTETTHFSANYLRSNQLAYDDTLGLRVEFVPQDTGDFETMIYLSCKEDPRRLDSIYVTGRSTRSELQAFGDGDFGYLKLGNTLKKKFKVVNNGNTPAYIDYPTFSGNFRFVNVAPALPTYLKPGDTLRFEVEFNPMNVKEYNYELKIIAEKKGASCPSEAVIDLHGIGIKYEISRTPLDFGLLPSCMKKRDTAWVRNLSRSTVRITDQAMLSGTNADNFTIIDQPPTGFELDYLDSAAYVIEFDPIQPHQQKSAILTVKTDHPDETEVEIDITGESEEIELRAADIDFGETGINRDKQKKTMIENKSSFDVHFAEVIENADWLDISPTDGDIESGKNTELTADIRIDEAKNYSAIVKVVIDSPCPDTVEFEVRAIGIKSSVDITPVLDYEETEFCVEKSIKIKIENTGKLPVKLNSQRIEGQDAALFGFEETLTDTTIAPDSVIYSTVIFKPENSANGAKSAKAITAMELDNEEVEYTTELKGDRYAIEFDIPDQVSIESGVNNSNSKQVEIENTGDYPFTIESMRLVNSAEFSFSPDLTGKEIMPENNESFDIEFLSAVTGDFTDTLKLKIESDNCDYAHEIALSGKANIKVQVWLPDTTAEAGIPNYCIPVKAKIITGDAQSIDLPYRTEISMAYDMFLPGIPSTVKNNKRIVNLSGNVEITAQETVIEEICGRVMLSLEDVYPLQFESFELTDDEYISVDTINGSLEIIGVCELNLRKVQSFEPTTMNIVPFPARDEAEITITTQESGNFSISIYSVEGSLIQQKSWSKGEGVRQYTIPLKLQKYSQGMYQVILRTPWEVLREQVSVVR